MSKGLRIYFRDAIMRKKQVTKERKDMSSFKWSPLKTTENLEKIEGFLPFTPGSYVIGKLIKSVMKDEKHGFLILKTLARTTVNVDARHDPGNKTGQAEVDAGALVGVRATHATKALQHDNRMIGKIFKITFIETQEKINKENKQPYLYHNLTVEIGEEE